MRVVITGGIGLIGRELAAQLTASGSEVVILSRNPKKSTRVPSGVELQHWDGRTADGWHTAADGADAIVNLAGENLSSGPWTVEQKRTIVESRRNAGRAVVEAVKAATQKPRVVVQASGVGYYGTRGDEVVTEEASPGSGFLAQVCQEWEDATAPVEEMGVRRVVARMGVVFSLHGGALPRLVMPARLFVGGPLGSGKQWYSWIHVSDVASAIRFLIDNPDAHGPFNVTSPHPLTNARLSRVLGRVLGRPALVRTPAFALRLVFGEMATVVLDGQRVVPQRLLALGFAFRFPDAEAALKDLLKA